jgi:hypothetical protein
MYVGIDLHANVKAGISQSSHLLNQVISRLEKGLRKSITHKWGDYEVIVTATEKRELAGYNLRVYIYGVDIEVDTVEAASFLSETLPEYVYLDSVDYERYHDDECEDENSGEFIKCILPLTIGNDQARLVVTIALKNSTVSHSFVSAYTMQEHYNDKLGQDAIALAQELDLREDCFLVSVGPEPD